MPSTIATPPKTSFIFHVGISGHRLLSQEESQAASEAIAEILETIDNTVQKHLNRASHLFTSERPVLRCISPLAQGADQLMAHRALQRGYELFTPLPFPQDVYLQDFPSAPAKAEFTALLEQSSAVFELDGSRLRPEEAYRQAGLLVLEHSDLLVVVLDENRTPTGIGGTAEIAAEAEHRGIPTVVIDPSKNAAIRLGLHEKSASWAENLTNTIIALIDPGSGDMMSSPTPTRSLAEKYFKEQWPTKNILGSVAALFENLIAGTLSTPNWASPSLESCKKKLEDTGNKMGTEAFSQQAHQVDSSLVKHYIWADQLALYYGSRYRSFAILRYLTSGVLLLGLILGFYSTHFNALGFILQVMGFGIILFLSYRNEQQEFHKKFLDYRYLAEHFRHSRYLALLGRVMPTARPAPFNKESASSWVNWHYRNIIREIGLVSAKVDSDYVQRFKTIFMDSELLEKQDLRGQISYYSAKKLKYKIIAHRLEKIAVLLFWLGLGAIVLRAFLYLLSPTSLGDWILSARKLCNMASFIVPAIAPIFFGLKSQGEYDRIATRYAAMENELCLMRDSLDQTPVLTSWRLGQMAEEAATRMVDEVSDWRLIVRSKKIRAY
ncbi:MAG: hypothetical protein PHI97_21415 [Desulfobulbus sp.]|nr:hypothetical protein [Desulfobulbus sp.]